MWNGNNSVERDTDNAGERGEYAGAMSSSGQEGMGSCAQGERWSCIGAQSSTIVTGVKTEYMGRDTDRNSLLTASIF